MSKQESFFSHAVFPENRKNNFTSIACARLTKKVNSRMTASQRHSDRTMHSTTGADQVLVLVLVSETKH